MHVDAAWELIRRAFQESRLAQAYLIAGPTRGSGGELAHRVLQLLFCRESNPPCGTCNPCRQVMEHTWADLFWLAPEKKSRIIDVDSMREQLLLPVTQTSLAGGWKAGVVMAADRMNDASANAFLKTLEEPPPKTLFLLLSDSAQLLLPTILSRCQRLELDGRRSLPEPFRGRLLSLLAAPFPPGVLPAMVLAGQLGALLKDIQASAKAEVKKERRDASEHLNEDNDVFQARTSSRYREMRTDLLCEMLDWYRDILLLCAGGPPHAIRHPEQIAVLRERASRLSLAQAVGNLEGIDELNRQLDRSLPEEALLAYWMDRLVSGVAASGAGALKA